MIYIRGNDHFWIIFPAKYKWIYLNYFLCQYQTNTFAYFCRIWFVSTFYLYRPKNFQFLQLGYFTWPQWCFAENHSAPKSHQPALCYRHKRWSCGSSALIQTCNVFKGVLVKAFFPLWKEFKALAFRKIAKWFWVGAKPSFAFMHFQG